MNDMTRMTTAQPRPVRRIRPKAQPLVLLPEWRLPAIDLWAVYPTGRMQSVKAKTFITYLERHLKRT